jgi:hypothetical protein
MHTRSKFSSSSPPPPAHGQILRASVQEEPHFYVRNSNFAGAVDKNFTLALFFTRFEYDVDQKVCGH